MSKFENDNKLIKVKGEIQFKLMEVLKERDITRYKLSKLTGIRYDTICNYCSGKVTLLNKEYLKIFCDVLNCQISDIIEYTNK
jgi:conserved domain protein